MSLAQTLLLSVVLGDLQEHAAAHIGELIAAFHAEQDRHVRVLLLGILAETGLPELAPFFTENLQAEDDLRQWAIVGLKKANTKGARRALWEAGQHS